MTRVTCHSQLVLVFSAMVLSAVVLSAVVLSAVVLSAVALAAEELPVPDFETDVQPILTRHGCNSGPCHGKARGQNGFQLSILAFDPDFDHASIAGDTLGRRAESAFPERSLLLMKATAELPHGGGVRFERGSPPYELLRRWIVAGMPREVPGAPRLERIEVAPDELVFAPEETARLTVTAHYTRADADGGTERFTRDVTNLAGFLSSEAPIVAVDEDGSVRGGKLPGEATIMARFMGEFATCHVTIPLAGEVPEELWETLPRKNFIDELVWKKLRKLGITPSATCSDSEFLRRAFIDAIGRPPSAAEAREFLDNPAADKRERLVRDLAERPGFAMNLANRWVDLLRPNPYRVGIKAVLNYDAWIREAFRENRPYDEFVRGLITARGSTWRNGAATLFRDRRAPDELATIVSQLFLGIRLECAKCHHHPFESLSQRDFYSFAAFFGRVGRKGTGLSPPISGGEEMVFATESGAVRHPLTGEVLPPTPLFASKPADDSKHEDIREALADWMTAPDNRAFRRVIVNRVWADLMGRGIVEPVDDFRATNPATNPELLDALADAFRDSGHDLRWLYRTIMSSSVYELGATPNERNVADTRNFSRHYRQRLRAEVLLDAICDITGVAEGFDAMPDGSRAVDIWTHRSSSVFLDTFGRPDANQDPPCFRVEDTSVAQALHLMNSPALHAKVTSDSSRIAELAAREMPLRAALEELYLSILSRRPTARDVDVAEDYVEKTGASRRELLRDLAWALLNTPEFIFKN